MDVQNKHVYTDKGKSREHEPFKIIQFLFIYVQT
jgi:hypothetical protein